MNGNRSPVRMAVFAIRRHLEEDRNGRKVARQMPNNILTGCPTLLTCRRCSVTELLPTRTRIDTYIYIYIFLSTDVSARYVTPVSSRRYICEIVARYTRSKKRKKEKGREKRKRGKGRGKRKKNLSRSTLLDSMLVKRSVAVE